MNPSVFRWEFPVSTLSLYLSLSSSNVNPLPIAYIPRSHIAVTILPDTTGIPTSLVLLRLPPCSEFPNYRSNHLTQSPFPSRSSRLCTSIFPPATGYPSPTSYTSTQSTPIPIHGGTNVDAVEMNKAPGELPAAVRP